MTLEERLRRDAEHYRQQLGQLGEEAALRRVLEALGLAPGSGIEPE